MSPKPGTIELVCGCMFSGKSETLLARLAAARTAGLKVAAFKHASDDRYSSSQIVTHAGHRADAVPVSAAVQIAESAGDAVVVLIDEGQFFGADLVDVCRVLADAGRDVIVAGLDRDSWGQPFGPIPELAAVAQKITHLKATCSCGAEAEYTQRIVAVDSIKMIGGPEAYEPRCRKCFCPPSSGLRC